MRNDYNPAGLSPETRAWHESLFRQAGHLEAMPLHVVRNLWDQYDGCNEPEGYEGEAIHLALNRMGDGGYCAV